MRSNLRVICKDSMMVVFDSVSARLSGDLCVAIPGDPNAKLAYLQQELKEHYPHVVITHSDNHLKVHGQLQEIVDLHNVLDVWFSNRTKTLPAAVIQSGAAGEPAFQVDSLTASTALQVPGHDATAGQIPAAQSDLATVSSAYNLNYVTVTPVNAAPAATLLNHIPPPPTEIKIPATQVQIQIPTTMPSTFVEPMETPPSNPPSNTSETDKVEASTSTEQSINQATSLNSSTDDISFDSDTHSNIKAVIKSWSNRKRNQEVGCCCTEHELYSLSHTKIIMLILQVQTDIPDTAPSPQSSGRRRKPGTPRKAKAHIPLKTEQPEKVMRGRSRRKPSRYSGVSTTENKPPTRRKPGRPPKNYSNILPEEMNPVEIEVETRKTEDTELLTKQGLIDAIEDDRLDEDEEEMEDLMEIDIVKGQPHPNQSSATSTLTLSKVESSKDGDEVEVTEERRGRKHKEGPCIAREEVEDILPEEDSKDMKCSLCSQVCKTRSSLKQHYLRCHLERKFQCMVCGKRYSMLKELASHKLTHNRRYQCPKCDKKFATQFLLDGHVDRKHINPKKKEVGISDNMNCPHCDFQAKSKKSLRDHNTRIHGEKTHQCPICNKMFALGKDLNQHVKFHTDTYQCEECGKSLKSKLALKLHISGIHRGVKLSKEKEYVCEDCGKICRNKTHFTEHVNKIHLNVKPFTCDMCDAAFFTRHSLKCHQTTHSDARNYVCDICGKGFKARSGLRVHRITHSEKDARPYSCSTCNKTFTQRGALVRHERIHSGDRPYKCRLCQASFNDYSILRRHVVGVHKIDDRGLCGRDNIDPNNINRGRPKQPGPSSHIVPDTTYPDSSSSIVVTSSSTQPKESAAEFLHRASQIIIEPSADGASLAHTIEATSDAHYALVEPAQRLYQLSTDDHSYTPLPHQQPQQAEDTDISTLVTTSHNPPDPSPQNNAVPQIHPASSQHPQHPPPHPQAPQAADHAVELIQLSDLSPQLLQQQQQPQQHATTASTAEHTTQIVPISVVNDMVHFYEHLEGGAGGSTYTIGMPVFPTPTPTTQANIHMMQPVQSITHLTAPPHTPLHPHHQQQQQQQAQVVAAADVSQHSSASATVTVTAHTSTSHPAQH